MPEGPAHSARGAGAQCQRSRHTVPEEPAHSAGAAGLHCQRCRRTLPERLAHIARESRAHCGASGAHCQRVSRTLPESLAHIAGAAGLHCRSDSRTVGGGRGANSPARLGWPPGALGLQPGLAAQCVGTGRWAPACKTDGKTGEFFPCLSSSYAV